MRQFIAAIAVAASAAIGLVACEPSPPGFQRVECVTGANNGPLIQNALNAAGNQVHLTGICTLDWRVRTGDTRYWVGFQVPNDHTVMISGGVVLRAGQTVVPKAPNGSASTAYAEIISNLNNPASNITVKAGPVDGAIIDGQSATQSGNGFDGISLMNCTNCSVEGVDNDTRLVVRNIRGLDNAGGPTESFGVNWQNCADNCSSNWVTVTSDSVANREVTSSGLATNSANGVTFSNSSATELHGRGYAIWNSTDITINNGFVHNVDGHGYGFEFTNAVDINGAWSSGSPRGALVLHDTSGLVATGLTLNPQRSPYTITLRNEVENPMACAYNSLSGNAWYGTLGNPQGDYETHGDALCQVQDNLVWNG